MLSVLNDRVILLQDAQFVFYVADYRSQQLLRKQQFNKLLMNLQLSKVFSQFLVGVYERLVFVINWVELEIHQIKQLQHTVTAIHKQNYSEIVLGTKTGAILLGRFQSITDKRFELQIFKEIAGKLEGSTFGHADAITNICEVAPQLMAAASRDNFIKVWEVSGKLARTVKAMGVSQLLRWGKYLLYVEQNNQMRIVDKVSFVEVKKMRFVKLFDISMLNEHEICVQDSRKLTIVNSGTWNTFDVYTSGELILFTSYLTNYQMLVFDESQCFTLLYINFQQAADGEAQGLAQGKPYADKAFQQLISKHVMKTSAQSSPAKGSPQKKKGASPVKMGQLVRSPEKSPTVLNEPLVDALFLNYTNENNYMKQKMSELEAQLAERNQKLQEFLSKIQEVEMERQNQEQVKQMSIELTQKLAEKETKIQQYEQRCGSLAEEIQRIKQQTELEL